MLSVVEVSPSRPTVFKNPDYLFNQDFLFLELGDSNSFGVNAYGNRKFLYLKRHHRQIRMIDHVFTNAATKEM